MDFYKELELIIRAKSPQQKFFAFRKFYSAYKTGIPALACEDAACEFSEPSYASFCKIVPPQVVPRRTNLTTKDGQIKLIHAIAHIEYSAIDLALDAAYRFRNMPKAYYDDWLEVADDEIRHFEMLEALLHELGAEYGDIEVHNSLFEASQRTQTLHERMAVVPRFLEANGLDATPQILEKLKKLPQNRMIDKLTAALEVILFEEISHVKKGDVWFLWACENEGLDKESYFEVIDRFYPQGFGKPRHVNKEARLEAGFSCSELKKIAKNEVCED